jgi:hypothetical protein
MFSPEPYPDNLIENQVMIGRRVCGKGKKKRKKISFFGGCISLQGLSIKISQTGWLK